MLRGLLWLVLASSTLVGTTACGGPDKTVKKTTKKAPKVDPRKVLADARDLAKNGDVDGADQKYGEAYAAGKSFDVLEERIDFLVHAGKISRAQEVAKEYYDANATDVKGYGLYAETLLVGNKGQEALEVADSMISFNADDPAGHEKRGRALLLLEKDQQGIEELRKAVQLDGASATYHEALGTALHKLG